MLIILATLLNELIFRKFKRFTQTFISAPFYVLDNHCRSWAANSIFKYWKSIENKIPKEAYESVQLINVKKWCN